MASLWCHMTIVAAAMLALASTGSAQQQSIYPDVRYAHASLGCVAWVIVFPAAAILVRVAKFRGVIWWHAGLQAFAYALFVVNVGTGIWLSKEGSEWENSHPIIGLILFCLATLQPISGLVHHILHKRHSRSTIWGHSHVILGRTLITIGIINGGLGLELAANASTAQSVAYGVIAGAIWLVYIGIMTGAEKNRSDKYEEGALLLPPSRTSNGSGEKQLALAESA